MSPSIEAVLRHVLEEVDFLIGSAATVDRASFLADEALRRAWVRSLEVIGEATKRLPAEFRDAHREVDWRGMAGMRDRLIHGYFAVDYDLVWEVATARVPELRAPIAVLLAG
ncbi:MAG TPA: DUF86 domain-containing protein [Thermoanaerobaculia bacterium]|nr:DUF86 domain-containing protein [Thermoanaerobaculia bacterium]